MKNKSRFNGSTFGFIGIYFVAMLLSACTLGIGAPWAGCIVARWMAKHTQIDGKRLQFDGTGGRFLGAIVLWMIPAVLVGVGLGAAYAYITDTNTLALVAIGAQLFISFYSFWLVLREIKWYIKHTHFEAIEEESVNEMEKYLD